MGRWVGKRSGPAERLLQLLAGRRMPGAGTLGAAEEGRDVRMRESSGSTWKRNTKTQQTHECTQARCKQGARAVPGKEPAALPSPTWSLPCGWRRPARQAPTRACESTASHAVKSWVGSSGWEGESLGTLAWPLVSWVTDMSARCPSPGTEPGLTVLGNQCSQPGPWSSAWYLFGPPRLPERVRIRPEVAEPGSGLRREMPELG